MLYVLFAWLWWRLRRSAVSFRLDIFPIPQSPVSVLSKFAANFKAYRIVLKALLLTTFDKLADWSLHCPLCNSITKSCSLNNNIHRSVSICNSYSPLLVRQDCSIAPRWHTKATGPGAHQGSIPLSSLKSGLEWKQEDNYFILLCLKVHNTVHIYLAEEDNILTIVLQHSWTTYTQEVHQQLWCIKDWWTSCQSWPQTSQNWQVLHAYI